MAAALKALVAMPADWCDKAAVEAWLQSISGPVAAVVAAISQQFHDHPAPESITEPELAEAIEAELERSGVPRSEWAAILAIILPLAKELLTLWINRRQQQQQTQPPDRV